MNKWAIVNVPWPEGLSPDHSRSLVPIYRDAMKAEIFERRDLAILEPVGAEQANVFSRKRYGSSTWALPWDRKRTQTDAYQLAWWMFHGSGRRTKAAPSWFQEKDSLVLYGVEVDKIRLVSKVIREVDMSTTKIHRDLLLHLWDLAYQASELAGDSVKHLHTLSLTLIRACIDQLGLDMWRENRAYSSAQMVCGNGESFTDAMIVTLLNRRFSVTYSGFDRNRDAACSGA
jgi:hypothetical protein